MTSMENQNEWWKEYRNDEYLHESCDDKCCGSTSSNDYDENGIITIIAEATRRTKLETWHEIGDEVLGFAIKSDKPCHEDDILALINSRIQQYGKLS